jgi:hypothetical protein
MSFSLFHFHAESSERREAGAFVAKRACTERNHSTESFIYVSRNYRLIQVSRRDEREIAEIIYSGELFL